MTEGTQNDIFTRVTELPPRSRLACIGLVLLTIALGLATRRFPAALPRFVALYAGDALWAAMVFWLAATLRPRARTTRLALAALIFAFAIEVSQSYHGPWIDALRATRVGALVLGVGFLWSDLACYVAGVALAVSVDVLLNRHTAARAGFQTRAKFT